MARRILVLSLWLVLSLGMAVSSTNATASTPGVSSQQAYCPNSLNEIQCQTLLEILKEASTEIPTSMTEFKTSLTEAVKSQLTNALTVGKTNQTTGQNGLSALLTSPALTSRLNSLPLNLQLKLLDRKEGDSVIGLNFSYSTTFNNTIYDDGTASKGNKSGSREHGYRFKLDFNGTLTQNAEENPSNFIVGKLSLSGSNYPNFDFETAAFGLVPEHCELPENIDNFQCAKLDAISINEFFEPMGASYYMDYGVDIGFESDQAFKAQNRTLGAFVFVAYEDFRRNTFLGFNNIKPALRFAIETIKPNRDTPRAILGEMGDYERLSGEFSVVVPLIKLANLPYSFTFSYRAFEELSPSELIQNAKLDSFQLKTFSLVMPTGLFVSYASGRLPFGLVDENTIELGLQTYF